MKKIINMTFLLCFIIIFGFMGLANAQRIVKIAPTEFGIINTTIEGDTLPDGNRVDPNTIYELERGLLSYYIFNGTLGHVDYHLHIRAEAGDDPRPKLVPGVLQGGVSQFLFEPRGDLTLEGLYMTGQDNSGVFYSNHIVSMKGEGIRLTVDDCLFHGDRSSFMETDAHDQRVFVTNTIMSYGVLLGRGIDRRGNRLDSLVVQNCTYINLMSRPLREGGTWYANYIKIDHVTFCNVGEEVAQLGEVVDVTFTNNLIINPGYLGVIDDGSPDAYFNTLRPLTNSDLEGKTQSITIRNNNLWLNPLIVALFGNLTLSPFVPYPVVERIFANERAAPLINEPSFLREPVEFTYGPSIDSTFALIKQIWEDHDGDPNYGTIFDTGPEGVNTFGDPLYGIFPFDLSYPTDATSYTAADGGLPLGDLNWFPEKKAEWITSIEQNPVSGSPAEFRLSQNYPNPFNPVTQIAYNLARKTHVTLSIYNTVGQKVATLIDEEQTAGSKTVTWNGTSDNGTLMSTGLYFYHLNAGEFNQTRKMLFLK